MVFSHHPIQWKGHRFPNFFKKTKQNSLIIRINLKHFKEKLFGEINEICSSSFFPPSNLPSLHFKKLVKIISIILNNLIKLAIDDFNCFNGNQQNIASFFLNTGFFLPLPICTAAFFPFQFPKTREIAACQNYFQKYREIFAVDMGNLRYI